MGDNLDNMSTNLPVTYSALRCFYVDTTEVTVGQFKTFLADTDYSCVGSWNSRPNLLTYQPTTLIEPGKGH